MSERLSEIARQLSEYLTQNSSQVSRSGKLQWYLAGSLATMALGCSESIEEVEIDESNKVICSNQRLRITEEQRIKISTFMRRLGGDVDVINVDGNLYYGASNKKAITFEGIKRKIPEITELMECAEDFCGIGYIDNLEKEHEILEHRVSKVKTLKGEVYILSLPEQFGFKWLETVILKDDLEFYNEPEEYGSISNYKRAIRDIAAMFYGFYGLYEREEFCCRTFLTLYHNVKKYRIRGDLEVLLENIAEQGSEYISVIATPDFAQEFAEFTENMIRRIRNVKREALMRRSTLQKRKKQLEELKEEEQKIIEAEKLIALRE